MPGPGQGQYLTRPMTVLFLECNGLLGENYELDLEGGQGHLIALHLDGE